MKDFTKAVEKKRREAGGAAVKSVTLRVSELSGISQEALQMMIDHAAEEMGAETFPVELVADGLLGHCPNCGIVPITEELVCTSCGAQNARPAGDEAMLLVSCEFE